VTPTERAARLERLLDDLGWLADDSGYDMDGDTRDGIACLRTDVADWLDAEEANR
jgi:hypothetical protein